MKLNSKRHFMFFDPFGAEVLHHLRALAHDATNVVQLATGDRLPLDFKFEPGDVYVPISGSPIRALCLDLDARAHNHDFQLMPVTIEGSTLQIGPRVVPGHTPCWECWNERSDSQHQFPEEWSHLTAKLDRNRSTHNHAFMPFTASLAAVRIETTLCSFRTGRAAFGSVWRMNIFTRDAYTADYVCRHRCPKCRRPDLPLERSIAGLASPFGVKL